jgi:hypothetical protein
MKDSIETARLREARENSVPWKMWGPYLSERQWGTVREDYSEDGNAWNYFTHDQARSRAYRWGEDGIAGISDDKQRLCFAMALWNGKDTILKERLFGLSNSEGNHGEDVKEYYFYLDSTPTHSYMKYLYKYPQKAFPYEDLVLTNRKRSRKEPEYDLIDTKVFDDDRYFDVFVEYAKESPQDILVKITVCNRGPEAATLHVLPTLWFRNDWSWHDAAPAKPLIRQAEAGGGMRAIEATHKELGRRLLYCQGEPELLFTENETNTRRIFGMPNQTPYVKDGINNFVVGGQKDAVNSRKRGTKASARYQVSVPARGEAVIRLRLTEASGSKASQLFDGFDEIVKARTAEADEFYKMLTPASISKDSASVLRQALAGMLWSKQYYLFDADHWLEEHGGDPLAGACRSVRNKEWVHMFNDDIISMPDKWEYPWYAAWDLAFHTLSLSLVDVDFAKQQLDLMLDAFYLHPSGQMPAYEWNFSDVNPPVHAWATMFLYNMEKQAGGEGDLDFLAKSFQKLMLNFTWWVNRKDRSGRNVFEGGFLGLDNIGVFDRSSPLPTGGYLEQADGTAWMAMFCQNMLDIAGELAAYDSAYEDMVTKFAEHFLWIASALNRMDKNGLWDEEDGFYYDLLQLPNGTAIPLKVRSMVGLLPLCATTVIEKYQRERAPNAVKHLRERLDRMPALAASIHATGAGHLGIGQRGILALVNEERLKRILARMLDEKEFLSEYGIRSLSRYHAEHPYVFNVAGKEYRVDYLPAESDSGMFGGNSNWRGPIWFPVNAMLIRALMHFYLYYGDNFRVECPTGSGRMMNLYEVAREISGRLERLFLKDAAGKRPVYGGSGGKFQTDPYWRDYILFYEYFNGDNGTGIGASHQTGWTGLVARLTQMFGNFDPASLLVGGRQKMQAASEWKRRR